MGPGVIRLQLDRTPEALDRLVQFPLILQHDAEVIMRLRKIRLKGECAGKARHCGAEFLRLRIGVGHPGHKDLVTGYVLKRGSSDTERAVERTIDDAMAAMPVLIDDGLNAAMKGLHTREST